MESHLPADPLTAHEPRVAGARARDDAFDTGRAFMRDEGPSAVARREARAGLYVHVPFCATRCTYCDFSSGAISTAALDRYVRGLTREAELRSESARGVSFHSVFFGGGTPSALPERHFTEVWRVLRDHFDIAGDAEITLEANPESVRASRLECWAAAGVNRLSMGAQSFVARELEALGRVHDVSRPAEAIQLARAHGFRRLSLDLMFGFPDHDATNLAYSLESALALGIEHLSAYCFIPEPGTPLGDATLSGRMKLPSPDQQADLYDQVTETCARAGLGCYETSNFCRPEAEARHNLVYWLRRPYLGLGPSAHSLLRGERFALDRNRLPESERERENDASVASEIVMLALRFARGIDAADYTDAEWARVEARYGDALESAAGCGRLEQRTSGFCVPKRARFIADDSIAWVLARERAPRNGTAAHRAEPRFDSSRAPSIMRGSCLNQPSPAI